MGTRSWNALALALVVIYLYPSATYYEAPLARVGVPRSSGSMSLLQLRARRSVVSRVVDDVKDELERLQTEIAALTAEVTGSEGTRRPTAPAWANEIAWEPQRGDMMNETVPVLFPVTLPLLPFAALVDTLKRKHDGHSYQYRSLADSLAPAEPHFAAHQASRVVPPLPR